MNVGEIITVASGKDFMILDILDIAQDKYLYTVFLDEKEMPTSEYFCFKKIIENDGDYVEMVTDSVIIEKIKNILTEKYGENS